MIHAFFEQQGALLVGCSVNGHASGKRGEQAQILCASVSSAMQLVANTLTECFGAELEIINTPDERGSLNRLAFRLVKPDPVQSELLRGLLIHFTALAEDFHGGILVDIVEAPIHET